MCTLKFDQNDKNYHIEDWIVPASVDSAILNSTATNVNSFKFGLSQDPGDDQTL